MIHLLSPKTIILWQSFRQGTVISPVGYRQIVLEKFRLSSVWIFSSLEIFRALFSCLFRTGDILCLFLQLAVGYLEPFPHKHCSHEFFQGSTSGGAGNTARLNTEPVFNLPAPCYKVSIISGCFDVLTEHLIVLHIHHQ